jgi:hypothetical protein
VNFNGVCERVGEEDEKYERESIEKWCKTLIMMSD